MYELYTWWIIDRSYLYEIVTPKEEMLMLLCITILVINQVAKVYLVPTQSKLGQIVYVSDNIIKIEMLSV